MTVAVPIFRWKILIPLIVVFILLALVFFLGNINFSPFFHTGLRQQDFQKGDPIHLYVNSLTSIHTQVPKDYYDLPFCQPEAGKYVAIQNMGERLMGNKITTSPYLINLLEDTYCQKVCQIQMNAEQAYLLNVYIKNEYHNNWILDNVPSAYAKLSDLYEYKQITYGGGFPIGYVDSFTQEKYVYNHVNIMIEYNKLKNTKKGDDIYRVTSFAVEPLSVNHKFEGGYEWNGLGSEGFFNELSTCKERQHMEESSVNVRQMVNATSNILYTYDVMWRESEIAWEDRWDLYLTEDHLIPLQVHWYSIISSVFLLVFCLSCFLVCNISKIKRVISRLGVVFMSRYSRLSIPNQSGRAELEGYPR